MRNWKHKIQLKDLHDQWDTKNLTTSELGKEVVKLLQPLPFQADPEFLGIVQRLEKVRTKDQYNAALSALYDFGDQGQRLWVGTFGL